MRDFKWVLNKFEQNLQLQQKQQQKQQRKENTKLVFFLKASFSNIFFYSLVNLCAIS